MQIAGLIGDPVEHSLSPFMHDAAFRELGIDARYELWATPLADLGDRVTMVRENVYLGANVTVPHKQAVIPFVDELSDTARRIGAVNTLIPHGGVIRGDNTDAYGFARSLGEIADPQSLRKAIVVGAGGASRAVLVSLQEAGIEQICLVNRTPDRAESLAESLNGPAWPAIQAMPWADLRALVSDAAVVVNATSIGWHGGDLPFDAEIVETLPESAIVMDLTYRETPLLRRAGTRGIRTVDGLPMLIYQGARSFELWTGQAAPIAVMTTAVLEEQTRRA